MSAPANEQTDAILLAAFGSRLPGAEASLDALRAGALERYPGWRVETAFTSGTVRRHKKAIDADAPSPREVLCALAGQGVRRLAVQSLHVVPGDEYQGLARLVEELRGRFARIELGRPLLGEPGDVRLAAETLLSVVPGPRAPGEAVLLMGHGTKGRANEVYRRLGEALRALDPAVLVGALEARPGLEEMVAALRAMGARTVHLMPLLFSRGAHAVRDMAGQDDASWRAGLERAGFACVTHVKGAGEHPALAAIWLDHLRDAVDRLLA